MKNRAITPSQSINLRNPTLTNLHYPARPGGGPGGASKLPLESGPPCAVSNLDPGAGGWYTGGGAMGCIPYAGGGGP